MKELQGLHEALRQLIRMLEDAVTVEATSNMYMIIGKIVMVQSMIDELEQLQEGWVNE